MVRRAQNERGSGAAASAVAGRLLHAPDGLLGASPFSHGGGEPESETDLCLRRSYDLVERLRRAAAYRSAGG